MSSGAPPFPPPDPDPPLTPPTSPQPTPPAAPIDSDPRVYTGVIEISRPLSHALQAMVRLLFQPFVLVTWLKLGFCMFLTQLAAGFGNASVNVSQVGGRGGLGRIFDFGPGISSMQALLLGLVVAVVIVFYVVTTWLECRGNFMIVEALARRPRAALGTLWSLHAGGADSLFLFRLTLRLCMWFIAGLIALVGAAAAWPAMQGQAKWSAGPIVALAFCILAALGVLLIGALVDHFIADFVVPTMWRTGLSPMAAWRSIWPRVGPGHLQDLAVFYLVRAVLAMAAGVLGQMAMCLTCCLGALPYVSAVLLLPATVTIRGFCLRYYEQFGADLTIFTPEPPRCPRCDYDLRGNPGARQCPECGAALTWAAGAGVSAESITRP